MQKIGHQRSLQQRWKQFRYLISRYYLDLYFQLLAFTGFMCLFSRRAWTNGYANDEGNAMKRYSHPLAKVWTLLLSQIILMGLVGFKIGGFSIIGERIFCVHIYFILGIIPHRHQ